MSQLAAFTKLPVSAVRLLIPAALIRRRLFRKPESKFDEYLRQHGEELGGFDGDGFFVFVVLMYLKRYCDINLVDENRGLALMAQSLSEHQGGFFAFFTEEDRIHEKAIRDINFNASKLRELCESIGAEYELYSDVGTLRSAANKIADMLACLTGDHVILVSIG